MNKQELVDALRPFANAADDLDDETKDESEIWEMPAAMSITAGALRKARDVVSEYDHATKMHRRRRAPS